MSDDIRVERWDSAGVERPCGCPGHPPIALGFVVPALPATPARPARVASGFALEGEPEADGNIKKESVIRESSLK